MTTKASRRVAFAVVAFLIAATVTTSSAQPASAQAVPGIDWMQYNMFGRSGHQGGAAPANRVIAHVNFMTNRGDPPVAVSLQETCHRIGSTTSQAQIITTQLSGYTTAHQGLVFLDPATDPLCTRYGNMLMMLGPRTGTNGPTWGSYFVLPDLGEDRGILCGRANLFGWHTACTTHLTPPSSVPGGAQAQQTSVVNSYSYFTHTQYPASGRYLGGDFNMTPSQMTFVSPNPYAFGLIEADDCCNSPTFEHPGADRKYDYSFVPRSLYSSSTATIWSTPESDHLLLEGHFS